MANVYGLKNVMAGEMVEFENGQKGMALNLEESSVGAGNIANEITKKQFK